MNRLNTEATLRACVKNNIEDLQHLVPAILSPNARIEKLIIGDRPYSSIPLLCVTIAYGSKECFDYLIEKGATTYYADIDS